MTILKTDNLKNFKLYIRVIFYYLLPGQKSGCYL